MVNKMENKLYSIKVIESDISKIKTIRLEWSNGRNQLVEFKSNKPEDVSRGLVQLADIVRDELVVGNI